MIYLIFSLKLVYFTYKQIDSLKIYQICHDLIDYFATLTSPENSHLGPIFRTGGSNYYLLGRAQDYRWALGGYVYICFACY